MRDAEDIPLGGGNIVMRNSQLAVTLWIAYHRLLDKAGSADLVEHYGKIYGPNSPGFLVMERELKRLAQYARQHDIRLFFMMIPDVQDLRDYKFQFVHDIMSKIAERYGYVYVDLLPAMTGLRPDEIWAMPGDPHPNALGHKLMADAIFPLIAWPKHAQDPVENLQTR
jgi:hypothetical protein